MHIAQSCWKWHRPIFLFSLNFLHADIQNGIFLLYDTLPSWKFFLTSKQLYILFIFYTALNRKISIFTGNCIIPVPGYTICVMRYQDIINSRNAQCPRSFTMSFEIRLQKIEFCQEISSLDACSSNEMKYLSIAHFPRTSIFYSSTNLHFQSNNFIRSSWFIY